MDNRLAVEGGRPVRDNFLNFHRPWIHDRDIDAVTEVLKSGWLTRGPKTDAFEAAFTKYVGCHHAIGLNSCTAALHLALAALGISEGDEVITSPITFPATANVVVHERGRPIFADVEEDTLNLDPLTIEEKLSPRTRAIIPVHFAGHPCEMDAILELAQRHGLFVIEDAAHAIEAAYQGRKVGTLGDFTAFSFYATKNLTTGEGGMLTTDDDQLAEQVRILSLHGISRDAWKRYLRDGPQHWEAVLPGYKYNMFDIQAALGLKQLEQVEDWWHIRHAYVQQYREAFAGTPAVLPLAERPEIRHAYHLFVIRLQTEQLRVNRDAVMEALKAEGIGTGLHFRALHLHPYYQKVHGFKPGDLPVAEKVSEQILSLPLYPRMTARDVEDVIEAVRKVVTAYRR